MIGVFGGTFDPVHFGHLRPALEVRQHLGLQEVRLVPCRTPPHRGEPVASAEQRLAMLQLAFDGGTDFVLDDRELRRPGPSYTVDTLESLRGEVNDTPLCLIVGMDAFRELPGWHQWTRLPEYAHLVVMTRPGWSMPGHGELAELVMARKVADRQRLHEAMAGCVFFCEVTQLEISASGIRKQLAAGRSPRFLLPDSVLEFIQHEGVYR